MILMRIVKHSQNFQNSKFAISLQYLKKEVRDEVGFLHVDKHQSFLQTLWASKMPTRWYYHYCWAWSSILKVLKVIGLQISLQYLKKEDMKIVHFLHTAEFAYNWNWPDFTGVQPCLLFLVSLQSQTVEMFCLNTAIQ